MSTGREKWIDIARGYGILAIVFMHARPPRTIIYILSSFSVPLFFVLSGYLFSGLKYDFKTNIIKKFNRLIVPYFCLGIIVVIYQSFKDYVLELYNGFKIREYIVKLIIQERYTSLWFVTCLFLSSIIFWIILKVAKGDITKSAVISVIIAVVGFVYYRLGGGALPWNFDISLIATFFLWIGYALRNCKSVLDWLLGYNLKDKIVKILLFVVIDIILTLVSGNLTGKWFAMANGAYGIEILTMVAALSGCAAIMSLSTITKSRYINYVGKNSMVYYAFNQSIVYMTLTWILTFIGFPVSDSFFVELARSVMCTVIIMAALYPVDRLISGTPLKFMVNGFDIKRRKELK